MARDQIDMTPIETRDELVAWIAAGEKPKDQFRVGTEHEKIPFFVADHSPVPYEGRRGIRALLEGMQMLLGWEPILEGKTIIGLADVTGGGAISLEPGGQFELSGAPLETIHRTCAELNSHLAQLRQIAEPLGIGFLGIGMSPQWTREQTPVMPKVSLALQPVATALFANSPFTEGRPNGYLSYRSHIWEDTDNARSGMLPFAFESGMGYERYVDYALDVPMYFIKRGSEYIDVAGSSFRDLLAGKHPAVPGERASISDWANHLSTIFPEVRLKRYLEMRGADTGSQKNLCALPALWVGLFYDDVSLDAAWEIAKGWSDAEREKLRADVPKLGLNAEIAGRTVHEIAKDVLALSRNGLKRRERKLYDGRDESDFLEPLDLIVERGATPADELLKLYHGIWGGSVDPAFELLAY
jgi:glutamate--cysteine ligase